MVSCCLIVKNEIDVFERCISSVQEKLAGIVDEIVVVDTGATDGTRELALEMGCRVFDFEWCDDFSKARNFSIEKANNDWILVIDADEFVVDVDVHDLNKLISQSDLYTIGEVPIVNYSDMDGNAFKVTYISRVFNKKVAEFKRSIHEYLCSKDGKELTYITLSLEIHHTGYVAQTLKDKNKTQRNLALIKKELEINPSSYLLMHLGKSYIDLKEYQKAQRVLKEVLDDKEAVKYEHYTETAREYLRCLILDEKFEDALGCEKYLPRCKNNEAFVYIMGQAYMKNGCFEKAMDCFVSVASKDDCKINKLDAIYSLGQLFEIIGFKEESANYYKMCGEYLDSEECYKRVTE